MGSRGIWTFMSARTRRSLTLTWTALFVLSLLLQYMTFAAAPSVLAAHNEGIFELDGNADDQATAGADWENGPEGALDSFFAGAATEEADVDVTYFTGGGSKDENDIPAWAITTNSVPDKDELLDAYAAVYQKDGETWVYFGADRFDNDGDAQIGFWFFQGDVGISGGDFTGAHVDGDVLILSEYTNGGVVDLVCAYEWDGSGGGSNIANPGACDPATSGSHLNLVAAGAACDVADGTFDICAVTNPDTANAPWPFTNKDGEHDFATGQFFEGGINLTDMFGGDAPCFGSFLAETRSSQETDAQLKDFAFGDFNTCVPPDITTTSSVSTADFGQQVTDSATFSGSNGAVTGTATFFICTPTQVTAAGCPEGAGTQVGAAKTISSGAATSDAYTVGTTSAAAGKYCWRVEYDPAEGSDYLAASHTNATTECFTVAPATISLVKTANPAGPVSAGDEIGFDIVVTNTGTTTTLNLTVTDNLPAGVDWTADAPTGSTTGLVCGITGSVGSEVLTCTKPSLAAGQSFTVHIHGVTDSGDCPSVTNSATVTTGNDGSSTDDATVTVNCPDVTVVKTPDGGTVNAGGTAQFTIDVTNNGPGVATNVTLTDSLPAGIDWDEDSPNCTITGAVGSEVLNCSWPSLADDETVTVHVSGLTDAGDCGVINNTATVDAANEPESANTNNTDSGSIEVLCAQIAIDKTANPVGPVNAGDEIGFDITVTNSGNGTATDVHVVDDLPAGVTWTADAPTGDTTGVTCAVVSNDLVCDDASMAAGDSFTVHVHGLTDAADCGTINNSATVTTGNDGQDTDDASVVVECPDLEVVKDGNGPIDGGEDAVFTITLTNHGPGDAYNVTLEDQLPAGSWTLGGADAGACEIDGSNLLTCDFGTVESGGTRTITVTLTTTADDCGQIDNEVTVGASNEPDNDQFPNTDDASIVVNCPDVAVEKTADVSPISAGEGASFTITVTNVGTGTAEGVTLEDQLDGSGWTLGGADAGDCSIDGSNVLACNFGDLAEGESRTFTVSRETTFDDCGDLPNAVTVSATNELDDFLDNNTDDATIEVLCPELGIVKTADHTEPVVAGGEIGFTITFANNGEGTAFDVEVSDTLDAGFSWTIESQSGGWSLVGNVLSWGPDDLAAGASATVHVVADTDFEDCGLVPNTAFLSQDGEPVDDDSAAEEVRCPDIGIDKSTTDEDGIVDGGQTVTFTILASVVEGPVTNGTITDVLPAGQTYVDGSQSSNPAATSFEVNGQTLTWTYATLDDGDPAVTITYDVTIAEDAEGVLTNVVEFCVSEVPNCESADETVTPNPELGIEKSNNAPIVPVDLGDGTTVDLPTAEEGDTVTYTLAYTVLGTVHNAIITDVLPEGVTYVDGTASNDAQFTFVEYDDATRTLTWTAPLVDENGSLTYDATIDVGASELAQPLVNVATIDSDETPPDDDDSPVFVPPVPLELTPPPTDTLAPSTTPSNPGFALMLILLAIAGFALAIGFITPVPEHVRRRDRLG
jgi:uncharacterized repeat protein (TIGR01451 family)/fimbrial isopeptide formation D2 family protein